MSPLTLPLAPSALGSDDILALYHDNDAKLQLVFDKYSRADNRAGGGAAALRVLLNITEFRMLLRDAGLLGGNHSKGVRCISCFCGGEAGAGDIPPLSCRGRKCVKS